MTSLDSKPSVSNTDVVLADLIDEIMNQQRRGEPVRLEAYAAKYPDHIQQLEKLFPALQALADLSQSACPPGSSRVMPQAPRGRNRDRSCGAVSWASSTSSARSAAAAWASSSKPSRSRWRGAWREDPAVRSAVERASAATIPHRGTGGGATAASSHRPDLHGRCQRGSHYYAMQLIDGPSLAEVIDQLRGRCIAQVKPAAGDQPDAAETVVDVVANALTRDAEGRRALSRRGTCRARGSGSVALRP